MLTRKTGRDINEDKTKRRQPDQSYWHRLQRSWLFAKIMPTVGILDKHGRGPLVSTNPCFHGRLFDPYTWTMLDAVKYGTFSGKPATFLRFEVTHYGASRMLESEIEVRLESRQPHYANSGQDLAIVACGPRYITITGMLDVEKTLPFSEWRRIETRLTEKGCTVMATGCKTLRLGLPGSFVFGILIVHTQPFVLKLFMSSDVKQRATVLKRAKVYPLAVDMATELRGPLVTCGKDDGSECATGCQEFGPEHMTAARWRELLKMFEAQWYGGQGSDDAEAWVSHA